MSAMLGRFFGWDQKSPTKPNPLPTAGETITKPPAGKKPAAAAGSAAPRAGTLLTDGGPPQRKTLLGM